MKKIPPVPKQSLASVEAQAQKYQQMLNDPDVTSDPDAKVAVYAKWVDATCQSKRLQYQQSGVDASLASAIYQNCTKRLIADPSAARAAAGSKVPNYGSCWVHVDPPNTTGNNSQYSYQVQCDSGVAPNKLAIVTPVISNLTGFALEEGIASQTTSKGTNSTTATFTFTPGVGSRRLSLTVPTASIEEKSATYFIASGGVTDPTACTSAPSTSGCFVGEILVPVPKAPPAPAKAKCPNETINTGLPSATLDAIETTSPSVTGKVQGVTTGQVQLCVAGRPLGDPVSIDSSGKFIVPVPSTTKLANGQTVVAQYFVPGVNGGTDTYGPTPDASTILVGSCSMAGAGNGKPPTLTIPAPDDKGMVTFSGIAAPGTAQGTTVRICVKDLPLLGTDGKEIIAKTGDANGNFTSGATTFKVNSGDQIVAQAEIISGSSTTYSQVSAAQQINIAGLVVGTPPSNPFVTSIVAGIEQSGYSSLGNNFGGFLSAFFRNAYIPLGKTSSLGFAGWGRVRLLSAPQPGVANIASILTNPTGQITTSTFNSIGTAIDYVVGPELKLREWKSGSATARVSLIAGAGATTPLNSNTVAVSYAVPPPNTAECQQLNKFYGQGSGSNPYLFANPTNSSCVWNPVTGTPYQYVSFYNQNRSNFLFKWGAGGRFTHVFPARGTTPSYVGALDLSVGQDSSVTGGKVSGWVFKLDGVYPIPFTGSLLYVFGSAAMRFTHNQNYAPLILAQPTSLPTPPSPQVAVLSQQQPNRDFYRLGFGLNLATIWCKFATAGCPSGSGDAAPGNGTPSITLDTKTLKAGSAGQTITVTGTGTNFKAGTTTVTWAPSKGTPTSLTPKVASATLLTFDVSTALLAAADKVTVTVDGATTTFTIN